MSGPSSTGVVVSTSITVEGRPAGVLIPVPAAGTITRGRPGAGVIVAAIDNSPVAGLVTDAAARLAAGR